ncbi:MAG: hypothetical protein JWN52_2721 [Actinomycetia bacterium]|nr:hypothetical protein [Actinomycetes bacterium]
MKLLPLCRDFRSGGEDEEACRARPRTPRSGAGRCLGRRTRAHAGVGSAHQLWRTGPRRPGTAAVAVCPGRCSTPLWDPAGRTRSRVPANPRVHNHPDHPNGPASTLGFTRNSGLSRGLSSNHSASGVSEATRVSCEGLSAELRAEFCQASGGLPLVGTGGRSVIESPLCASLTEPCVSAGSNPSPNNGLNSTATVHPLRARDGVRIRWLRGAAGRCRARGGVLR